MEKSRTVPVEKNDTVKHKLPQYEGQLSSNLLSPASRRALEQRRERTYSVSQLETYGECPFRYFSDRVLNLNPTEEEETGLTSMEKGSLAHKILFEFYDRRRDVPSISGCENADFDEAVADLRRIARDHLNEAGG